MNADKSELIYGELTDRVIGIFYSVHNELGFGFVESVYENALSLALRDAGLGVLSSVNSPLTWLSSSASSSS